MIFFNKQDNNRFGFFEKLEHIENAFFFFGTGGGNFGNKEQGGNTGGIGSSDYGAGEDDHSSDKDDDVSVETTTDEEGNVTHQTITVGGKKYEYNYDPSTGQSSLVGENSDGGYDVDIYENSIWGTVHTSISTTPLGSIGVTHTIVHTALGSLKYDTHHYADNTAYGIVAELVADVAEGVFDVKIHEDVAKAVDVASGLVSVGLAVTSFGTSFALLSSPVAKLQVLGALSLVGNITSVYDSLTNINALLGGSSGVGVGLAMESGRFESDGNGDRIFRETQKIVEQEAREELAKKAYLSHLINNDLYKFMAGGEVYQGVFAGGDFFDATTAPIPIFSVGEPYVMSEDARRVHAPYAHFLPKNMAGSENFSVFG